MLLWSPIKVNLGFTQVGKPAQNGFVESKISENSEANDETATGFERCEMRK